MSLHQHLGDQLDRSLLPEVSESPVASARVSGEAARATGLGEGTPVVGGAGDQAAQAVGSGIVADGAVSITLGTSGVVFASSGRYGDPGRESPKRAWRAAFSQGRWSMIWLPRAPRGASEHDVGPSRILRDRRLAPGSRLWQGCEPTACVARRRERASDWPLGVMSCPPAEGASP